MSKAGPDAMFRFFNEVGIINQLASTLLERRLPAGVKLSQFMVLNHLVRLGGGWAPARLARAFQVTKGAMTHNLKRLESVGLVDVVPDPGDGRAKQVTITDAGRRVHAEAIARLAPDLETAREALGQDRIEAALPFLEAARRYLDEQRP